VIYDAIEQVYAVANANFATDFAALATAKGVVGLNTNAAIEKRQSAETMVRLGAALPCLGIVGLRARSQAKDQGKRDTESVIAFDYYAEHADPVLVAKQAELAAEALLRTVDRLWASGASVFGAGELPLSVVIDFTEGYLETRSPPVYWRSATVTFPVHDRDEGL